MTPDEFGAKIKAKYPDYADMDNTELSRRIVAKHPDYASQVDFGDMKDAPASPRMAADSGEALITNLPTQNWKQDVVRGIPAGIGGMAGAGALATASLPFAPLAGPFAPAVPIVAGMIGAGLGGFGGEGARQGVAQGTAAAFPGEKLPMLSTGQAIGQMGIQGATNAAGEGIGLLAGPAVKALGRGMVNNPLARSIGNYSKDAAGRLLERPAQVISEMGEGAIGRAAQGFKDAISATTKEAGDAYRALIDKVVGKNSKYGPNFRLNLQDGIGNDVAAVAKEYGYGQPGRIGAEAASQEKFLDFARLANELKDATPEQVYYFQRDLGHAANSATDRTLQSALNKVKAATGKYLETNIPEIGPANKGYAAAMGLAEDLGGVTNSDDAARLIKNKLAGNGETRQAIMDAAEKHPAVKEALDRVMDANAGAQFGQEIAPLPRTGFAGSLAYIAGGAKAAIIAPFAAAGVSPLATAYATKAAQAVTAATPKAIYRVATAPAAGVAAALIEQHYLQQQGAR